MPAKKSIKPSDEEKGKFWESLAMCKRSKPVVLATVEPYCEVRMCDNIDIAIFSSLK